MKMLKAGLMAVALFMLTGVAVAQSAPDRFLVGDFSPDKAVEHLSDFLPVYFNNEGFSSVEIKGKVGQAAQHKLVDKGGYPYQAYFNAAVIYATPVDAFRTVYPISATDAANAIRYATKAISLSPKAPYMYLVRGEVYQRQSIQWDPHAGFVVSDRAGVEKGLADYEKVMDLQPAIAPYDQMAVLARALGLSGKVSLYEKLAETQRVTRSKHAAHAAKAQKAVRASFGERLMKALGTTSKRAG